jgi:hypothetical protein
VKAIQPVVLVASRSIKLIFDTMNSQLLCLSHVMFLQ